MFWIPFSSICYKFEKLPLYFVNLFHWLTYPGLLSSQTFLTAGLSCLAVIATQQWLTDFIYGDWCTQFCFLPCPNSLLHTNSQHWYCGRRFGIMINLSTSSGEMQLFQGSADEKWGDKQHGKITRNTSCSCCWSIFCYKQSSGL